MSGQGARSVTFDVSADWPTPENCRRVAAALDAISPARYGDILRAYAEAEDDRFDRFGSLAALAAVPPEGEEDDRG